MFQNKVLHKDVYDLGPRCQIATTPNGPFLDSSTLNREALWTMSMKHFVAATVFPERRFSFDSIASNALIARSS